MRWDASTYLRFGDARTRPAADLLARVELEAPRLVVDLGCGPGNSTALLRERWPRARLVGVDASEAMLERARAEDLAHAMGARWVRARIEDWRADEAPDLLFSNAALHWVGEHETLVPRLADALAPGGVLAFQVPQRVPGQAFVEALLATAREEPWAARLAELPFGRPGPRTQDYFAWLAGRARTIDAWSTEYLHALEGEDAVLEWTRGTALLPFLERLDERERERFVARYGERLRQAYPRRADGLTLFAFQRLFVVARR